MAFTSVTLKISIVKDGSTLTMQFDRSMLVCDVCNKIFQRASHDDMAQCSENGLFKPLEDSTRGHWLSQDRSLEYYDVKSGDMLLYTSKYRPLRIKTLDGSVKTLLVDESQTIAEITKVVCDKIGLHNPEEFSLTSEEESLEQSSKRSGYKVRNKKKLDILKKKLHTDEELNWLNVDKPLCEQGIDKSAVLTLRKKFFFSDQNVQWNDPVQLNLLYVQLRDDIINGTHPCTHHDSVQLAALQCQITYGNYNDVRHKPGFLDLPEFLPGHYIKLKGVENAIFVEHRKLHNLSEVNAKFRYIQFCRSLPTYGVTFFVVKEKLRYRTKLVPRLLGITREGVMRVDEKTKEVLKTWPFSSVRGWAATPTSLTLDFGAYSKSRYSVHTSEGYAICQVIEGYVEMITQKKSSNDHEVPKQEENVATLSQRSTNTYDQATRGKIRDHQKPVGMLDMKRKGVQQHLESKSVMHGASCAPQPAQKRKFTHNPSTQYTPPCHPKPTSFGALEIYYNPKAASRYAGYERVKRRADVFRISDEESVMVGDHSYENARAGNDYMTLIKTYQADCEADDYQSLQPIDEPLFVAKRDDDSTNSSENDYQPLLLENMKDITNSRDSSYQTLFYCPDPPVQEL